MTINPSQTQSGNDLYREMILPDTGEPFPVTYWDLWFILLLTGQFFNDWEALSEHFRQQANSLSWRRNQAEGALNHLLMLRQSLEQAGLAPDDILKDANLAFLKKQKPKARYRLLELNFREHEQSTWMRETPRKLRESRALRGYWERFSISPLKFAPDLAAIFKTGRYHLEEESFKLESKLSGFLDKQKARLDIPGQLALYRAFLTVVLENMNGVDDSFGVIGDLYESNFEVYFRLDRTLIDLPLEIYFQDLLELLTWEDYAFTYRNQPAFFASLSEQEVPIVEAILRQQWQELDTLELVYQSEKALTMLGLLYAQQEMFEQFIPVAGAMGTRQWQRITILAKAAEKRQRYDLALAVYEACLKPGMHEAYLREKYENLKSRIQDLSGKQGN